MVQTNEVNSMNDEAFADLREAMEDALAYERGELRNLKVSRIQAPPRPRHLLGRRTILRALLAKKLIPRFPRQSQQPVAQSL